MSPSTPLRRTQEERSAVTREALLDATIECLAEVGYARTTTRAVAERAGVSRGAQTHHYATKDELVVAAVEHLFEVQGRLFVHRFRALAPSCQTMDEGVRLLWEIVAGPSYPAVLEMVVAARTDPALRVVVHAVAATLQETVVGLFRSLMPALGDDDQQIRTVIDVVFALVQRAAIASYGGFGDPDHAIDAVRSLARQAADETPGGPR